MSSKVLAEDGEEALEELSRKFKWPEYLVFSLVMAASAGIGIFYGCFKSKQKTTEEFLLANKAMRAFPTAMSLTASFMSAIILLGTPAEMYTYGTMYWDLIGGYFLAMASAAYLYAPVFFKLGVTSVYEYLELRFSRSVRILASILVTIQLSIYMAIAVYAPSLALEQVTGIDVYLAVSGMFLICIFYTTLVSRLRTIDKSNPRRNDPRCLMRGGMKAVMWTDTLQVLTMMVAMATIVVKGVSDMGGPSFIWNEALNGSRIEFLNTNLDPRERHTVWGLVIGGYFTWIALYGTNQAQVQRYMSVPSLREAQKAIWINFISLSLLLCICCYAGLVLYAKYRFCDPLLAGEVTSRDQMFPLFVMETVGDIPGLPGLFVAGVFSGALSTVSSGINALSATALEDFAKIFCPDLKDSTAALISKLLAVFFGLLSLGLVFVAAQMGGVLQAANSIFGMIGGPLLGLFTLGIFFPWANEKGALVGTLTSIGFMFWLGIGANVASLSGNLVIPKLPISMESCTNNITILASNSGSTGGLLEMYRVSYIWYSTIGCFVVLIVGLLISLLTGVQDPRFLPKNLISPAADKFVKSICSDSLQHKINWDIGGFLGDDEPIGLEVKFKESSGSCRELVVRL